MSINCDIADIKGTYFKLLASYIIAHAAGITIQIGLKIFFVIHYSPTHQY